MELYEEIARRHLKIETLQERKSDSLDFHTLSVWALREALVVAYEAGKSAGIDQVLAMMAERHTS